MKARVSHLSVGITSFRVAGRASHPARASSLAPRTSCGRTRRPMNARRVVTVAVMTTKPRPHSPRTCTDESMAHGFRVRRLTVTLRSLRCLWKQERAGRGVGRRRFLAPLSNPRLASGLTACCLLVIKSPSLAPANKPRNQLNLHARAKPSIEATLLPYRWQQSRLRELHNGDKR